MMKIDNLRDKIDEASKDDIFRLLSLASQRAETGRGPIGKAQNSDFGRIARDNPYHTVKRSEFDRVLTSRGFEIVGQGHFSTVWGKPGSNKVVKIIYPGGDEVDCSAMFLKLARRNNVNKHFPRVFNIKYIDEENTLVAVIERLQPVDLSKIRWTRNNDYNAGLLAFLLRASVLLDGSYALESKATMKLFARFIANGSYSKLVQRTIHKDDVNKPLWEAILLELHRVIRNIYSNWIDDFKNTSLVKAINKLDVLTDKCPGTFLDLKLENIMMRKDGTLVLSDPLAF